MQKFHSTKFTDLQYSQTKYTEHMLAWLMDKERRAARSREKNPDQWRAVNKLYMQKIYREKMFANFRHRMKFLICKYFILR